MSNSNINESRNDRSHTNLSQDVQNETNDISQPRSQESDIHQLPDQTGGLGSNTPVLSSNQGENWQEEITEDHRGNWQQPSYSQFDESRNGDEAEMDTNWQESPVNDWPQETPGNVDREQGHPQEAQGVWHEDGSREAVESWSEGPSDPPRTRRAIPIRRFSRFHPPEDDNVYSMELRELLSRYVELLQFAFSSRYVEFACAIYITCSFLIL